MEVEHSNLSAAASRAATLHKLHKSCEQQLLITLCVLPSRKQQQQQLHWLQAFQTAGKLSRVVRSANHISVLLMTS